MNSSRKEQIHTNRGKIRILSSLLFVTITVFVLISKSPPLQKGFLFLTSLLVFIPEIVKLKSLIGFKSATQKLWIKNIIVVCFAGIGIVFFGKSYRENSIDIWLFLLCYSTFFPILEFLFLRKKS